MGTGYVRNDAANNIADAGVINATDLDGEFDAILAAFVAPTGHTHSGTAAEGGAITVFGPVQDFVGGTSDFSPKTDSTYDLGKTAVRWRTAYVDDLNITTNIVVGGTVDGRDVAVDGAKLDLVEASATADQTGAQIKSAYEAEANTNTYTDAEVTKLAGIETSADVTDTANVTAAGALMDSEVDVDIKTLVLPPNTTISPFGRTLVGDANVTAVLGTLGVSSTPAELNILDGATLTTAELNFVDGVTSGIQAQLNTKLNSSGVSAAGAALINDANAAAQRATLGAAPLESPTFTGFPRSVTTPLGDSTTRTATTEFVDRAIPAALNASGSAPLYGCRAWVNFNGTGTVAIRASGNVSSITDNGTGDYTINFATAMQDANYATVANWTNGSTSRTGQDGPAIPVTYDAGSVRILLSDGAVAAQDGSTVSVAIFR